MEKRNLSFWEIWNINFGFLGVQIAYALQNTNNSRIFATLGADPHNLSYFWILPPLLGLIVQPIVGVASDRTWTRFGRRIPYLFIGAIVSVIVMALLPNAGSFNLSVANAMIFGLIALIILDTAVNMAMQPFKMMVGDMVNEKQKKLAYSVQSFVSNAGNFIGFLFPIFFTWIGIQNTAPDGVVPDSVIYSFYVGAAILILCVLYTIFNVKEMPPEEYAKFHGIQENTEKPSIDYTKLLKNVPDILFLDGLVKLAVSIYVSFFGLLKKAPKVFWTVGLVQFFCWAAFVYMWTYTTSGIAETVWNTTDAKSAEYQNAGNWVGVLFAVQSVGSIIWAIVLPFFKTNKSAYFVSLILGGIGFIATFFVHDKYLLFIPFLLIGCAWAAILALPFTILTNALKGSNMGAYLGLFNGTICVPQIIAATLGGVLLTSLGGRPIVMLLLAGILLIIGAFSIFMIKENEKK
ncbi:MFS transporter [Capnocytophaga catalasegens]|uniref:Sugar transporter n=1 Tax=Capnocytophaga catalasegens TaxID=1004260 RepID=A0AAV5AVU7_9FLAO|nr:MFS transporter [Capnocytophaga catalasegens]GIZ14166.1 sugar transporter [Capnocytophaga catalasegens]GJM51479.1 sugar transporter [Capnocytophaga catalasegens]GJM53987.1 sugar transporter [Capnocytophaga catalasegens]